MMTIRRSVLERGFEPDNCYYVQHESQMWDKKKINFKTDPPPDLAIEVEVTRKLLNKTAIYASFRVPELWCWSGNTLKVLELRRKASTCPRNELMLSELSNRQGGRNSAAIGNRARNDAHLFLPGLGSG